MLTLIYIVQYHNS